MEKKIVMNNLGQLVITTNALNTIGDVDSITNALRKYVYGDWGDTCKEDWKLNDWAVDHEERVMGIYKTTNDIVFWIITEWDRSVTTVLLPEDY